MSTEISTIKLARVEITMRVPALSTASVGKDRDAPHWIVMALQDMADHCNTARMKEIEVLLRRVGWEIETNLRENAEETGNVSTKIFNT